MYSERGSAGSGQALQSEARVSRRGRDGLDDGQPDRGVERGTEGRGDLLRAFVAEGGGGVKLSGHGLDELVKVHDATMTSL
jgi:hypothetical protein